MIRANMVPIARAIQQEAYDWLEANHPEYLTAIEEAITQGANPDQIKRFVITHAGDSRTDLAQRMWLAAINVSRIHTEDRAQVDWGRLERDRGGRPTTSD